jgi:hypothetical protein
MYLTAHQATAVPDYAGSELHPHDDISPGAAEKTMSPAHLLQRSHDGSVQAEVGDIMFIRHCTPHHGTANNHPTDRRFVLFDLISDIEFLDQQDLSDQQVRV